MLCLILCTLVWCTWEAMCLWTDDDDSQEDRQIKTNVQFLLVVSPNAASTARFGPRNGNGEPESDSCVRAWWAAWASLDASTCVLHHGSVALLCSSEWWHVFMSVAPYVSLTVTSVQLSLQSHSLPVTLNIILIHLPFEKAFCSWPFCCHPFKPGA